MSAPTLLTVPLDTDIAKRLAQGVLDFGAIAAEAEQ